MIFHNMLSDMGPHFGRGPKRGVNFFFFTYFLPRVGLIVWTKIQFKNLKFGMGGTLTWVKHVCEIGFLIGTKKKGV